MKEPPGRSPREGPPVGTTWSEAAGADLTWGVGAVAGRLGVAASTLRTWERRYGVGPSHRTQGGHRRYTERDIDRVELVRRLVSRGVSAQDAARVARHLDREELRVALATHEAHATGSLTSEDLVDAFLAAAVTTDTERLEDLLQGLMERDDLVETWTTILSPGLSRMACERSTGSIEQPAERAATAVVVEALRRVRDRPAAGAGAGAQVLLASAVDDAECLPLLALGAALVRSDVPVRTTGPETDGRAIADLTRKIDPRVVVLWGQPPGLDSGMLRHLSERSEASFLLRAGPAWPHEVGLRFGADERVVTTDVAGALRHVLDRTP